MNNHPRGVYEPLMDNVPIYDLSDEEIEEAGLIWLRGFPSS